MKSSKIPFLLLIVFLSLKGLNASAETAAHLITIAPYKPVYTLLQANVAQINTLLLAVKDQPSYGKLVTFSRALAAKIPTGRVTITLPDGTAVFDGAQADDPGDTLAKGNSYNHFINKTITENLNTRISNLDAQEHVDGLGAETRFSSVTLKKEVFVAIRLGPHLNNNGTARLSIKSLLSVSHFVGFCDLALAIRDLLGVIVWLQ
jgi:hypothetical protein